MAGKSYAWDSARYHSVPVEVAVSELERLRNENGGVVSPGKVVDAARPDAAPLHREFEWNDAVAAEAHRVDTARRMIRGIVFIDSGEPKEAQNIRAYVSVSTPHTETARSYTSLDFAMSDVDMRAQVLGQARADMAAFQRKYAQYLALAGVAVQFEKALAKASKQIA